MDLVSRSEKGAIISEHHKVGKGKCFAQCVNQNSEGRRSFFFYFSLSLFFSGSFEEQVLLTSAGTDCY